MTSFKNYFNYIFKKSRSRLLITLVIALIITVSSVDVYTTSFSYEEYHKVIATVSFGWVATILGFLCFLTPILELEGFKNRRNIDALFSFPVSKFKMGLAHYLNGIIYIVSTFTVCSIYTFFYLQAGKNVVS